MGKLTSMLSVTYGTSADLCYSGGADGRVYHWRGSTLSKVIEAHKGPVFAVQRVEKVHVHGHLICQQWPFEPPVCNFGHHSH